MPDSSDNKEKNSVFPLSSEREFRKTNEAIGIRVSEGAPLSLLSRKVFNSLVYHAQKQRVPGQNAPTDDEVDQNYFWIPFSDLARDTAYDSRDTQLLKDTVEELQKIQIFRETRTSWVSETLLASAKIHNSSGLKTPGGRLMFGFSFPPEVMNAVLQPSTYTRLSLYFQKVLRSGPALALYEIARRFINNPSKLTLVETWEWWFGSLTGNPVSAKLPEYKYFKRDTVVRAMKEVNSLTDINVELIEHKVGRRVTSLQFRVTESAQSQLQFMPDQPIIDVEMLERMVAIGLPEQEAKNLHAQYGAGKIATAMAYLEKRLKSNVAAKIDSKAAYFRNALKGGYAVEEKSVSSKNKQPEPQSSNTSIRDKYLAFRAKEAIEAFLENDPEDCARIFAEFRETNTSRIKNYEKAMVAPSVRYRFGDWYARKLWGEPADSDILVFAETLPKEGV